MRQNRTNYHYGVSYPQRKINKIDLAARVKESVRKQTVSKNRFWNLGTGKLEIGYTVFKLKTEATTYRVFTLKGFCPVHKRIN